MRPIAIGLIGLSCAACSDSYYARRDTLSAGSGDAVRANIAIQVANPHPPSADRVGELTNGEYLQHAYERYRNPASGTGAASAQPTLATTPPPR